MEPVKPQEDPESKFKKFMGMLFDKPKTDPETGDIIGVQKGLLTGIGRGLVGYSQGLKGNVVDYSAQDTEINQAYMKMAEDRKKSQQEAQFNEAYANYLKGMTPGALPGNPIAGQVVPPPPVPGAINPQMGGLSPMAFKGIPQAQYGMTGMSPTGMTIGQTPESKAQFDIATDVLKQEAKEQAKTERETSQALPGMNRFIKNVVEVQEELKSKFPKIGDATYTGLMSRIGASALEKTGTLPKTTAFLNRAKVIANQQARTVEGGRITDQDRTVYADAMANAIKLPTEANVTLAGEALLDLKDKGGNIAPLIESYRSSEVDFLQGIADYVESSDGGFSSMSDEELRRIANGK